MKCHYFLFSNNRLQPEKASFVLKRIKLKNETTRKVVNSLSIPNIDIKFFDIIYIYILC